jgi:uncharacterized membrane protein YccF (DUF307 family)
VAIVAINQPGPSFLVRALWYLFIGWWLAGFTILLGYVLALTIIGLPLALMIFNRLGTVLTLRPYKRTVYVTTSGGMTTIQLQNVEQFPLHLRAIYFVFVGWWLGALWLSIAYFLCLLIIPLPLGLFMMNRTGMALTLYRYD